MNDLFPELQEEKHLRAYVPGPFIVAGLPARDVKNLPFKRKYNNITLTLTGSFNPFNQVIYSKSAICISLCYKTLKAYYRILLLFSTYTYCFANDLDSFLFTNSL